MQQIFTASESLVVIVRGEETGGQRGMVER